MNSNVRLPPLLAVIGPFLELNTRMPLRCLQALLQVAAYPGRTVSDHAQISGLSLSTMSRNLLDLGERNRHFEKGLGLVISKSSDDQRERRYYLTKIGQRMIDAALNQWNEREKT